MTDDTPWRTRILEYRWVLVVLVSVVVLFMAIRMALVLYGNLKKIAESPREVTRCEQPLRHCA